MRVRGGVESGVGACDFHGRRFSGAPICLLNARPANETIVVEAVRLTNLVETDRITESFVPGLVPFEKTRLAGFVAGEEVLVLEAPSQARLLEKAFGPGATVSLSDLAPLIAQFLPGSRRQEPPQDPAGIAQRDAIPRGR